MAARIDAIAPVLAALRDWRGVYERWLEHPGRRGGDASGPVAAPWSAADEARLERLAGTDPGELAASAARLDAVATDLGVIGWTVGTAGVRGGIGTAAEGRCVELATAITSRVAELTGLAEDLRSAAASVEALLAELAYQEPRVGEGVDGGAHRFPALAHRDVEEADRAPGARDDPGDLARWAGLDELVARHAAVVIALRAAAAAAERALGDPGGGWAGSCGPGIWVSEGPQPVDELVVDQDYEQRVGQVWQPLPAPGAAEVPEVAELPRGAGIREVADVPRGAGPLLPGTEGGRSGTDLGVRIAQLPDAAAPVGTRLSPGTGA